MVWSLGKSRLFLPTDMGRWSTACQNAVLLHELVHLKRRDPVWFLVGQLARAVNWFNPLAWYAVQRLRIECEQACDDHVLRLGVNANEYAGHLLELSTSVRADTGTGSLALAMASKSNVENRIVSILDERMNRCGVTLQRAVGVLVVVSLGVAALATLAATATEKDTINDKDEEVQVKYPYCVVKVDDLEPRSLEEGSVDDQDFQGKIVEVQNAVYINLGRGDGLRPGVRFGVVNSDESRVADAHPKARIEVVEVIWGSEHLSRCKVLSDRHPTTILRGDLIYSPTWQPGRIEVVELIWGSEHLSRCKVLSDRDPTILLRGDSIYSPTWQLGRKVEFALIGKMDIDGDGIDDRETIKAMIAQNGGLVTMDLPPIGKGSGELSATTRWMVIGDDFKVLDEGDALESKAKSLGISRIHVDKLLGWLRGSRADGHRP